uniref:Uncharacterized protein n=1 Tax=Rhizophora mucronata TaxID=61149 RepID=A0A2P2N6A8_RHIMU
MGSSVFCLVYSNKSLVIKEAGGWVDGQCRICLFMDMKLVKS